VRVQVAAQGHEFGQQVRDRGSDAAERQRLALAKASSTASANWARVWK
jgi:hypothetical protein